MNRYRCLGPLCGFEIYKVMFTENEPCHQKKCHLQKPKTKLQKIFGVLVIGDLYLNDISIII